MCYNGGYKELRRCELEQISKNYLSSDCRLQLALHEVGIASNRGSARHGECFGALYTPPVTSGKCDRLEVSEFLKNAEICAVKMYSFNPDFNLRGQRYDSRTHNRDEVVTR